MAYQHERVPNDAVIVRFLEYLTVEKGLAPLTIEAYRSDLAQLAKFLGTRRLVGAGRRDIGEYVANLLSGGMDGRSVARKVSALRQFFRFLVMEGLAAADPTITLQSPKTWKVLPKSLSPSEMDAVLNFSTNLPEYLTRRNRAMFELLYAAGLRASEIIGARLANLNLIDRYLIVRGKGDKERIAPFGQPAAEALKHYLAQRHLLTQGSPWLFVGRCGQPLSRMRLWQIVNARSQAIGRNVSPHMFRHSCVTDMMQNGADLRTIQTVLGHADISTTQIYTHLDLGFLRKNLQHHPRNNGKSGQLKLQMGLTGEGTLPLGPILCAHCMSPVCEKSKWYCELHLRLNREAIQRLRTRKRSDGICRQCSSPYDPTSNNLCTECLRKHRESDRQWRARKKLEHYRETSAPIRRPPSPLKAVPQVPAPGRAA